MQLLPQSNMMSTEELSKIAKYAAATLVKVITDWYLTNPQGCAQPLRKHFLPGL